MNNSEKNYAYYVFLDILGYRQLLELDTRGGTENFKERLIRAFRTFDDVNRSRFPHKVISDSIFISCSDREAAEELLHLVQRVFQAFLQEGLLIRGGISFGAHFENQTITYSPVLSKAYALESELADVPRIMIDPNILTMFPSLKAGGLVLKSGANWFLNIVTATTFNDVWQAANKTYTLNHEAIEKSDQIRFKHRWLQDYLLESAELLNIEAPKQYLPIFDRADNPRNN